MIASKDQVPAKLSTPEDCLAQLLFNVTQHDTNNQTAATLRQVDPHSLSEWNDWLKFEAQGTKDMANFLSTFSFKLWYPAPCENDAYVGTLDMANELFRHAVTAARPSWNSWYVARFDMEDRGAPEHQLFPGSIGLKTAKMFGTATGWAIYPDELMRAAYEDVAQWAAGKCSMEQRYDLFSCLAALEECSTVGKAGTAVTAAKKALGLEQSRKKEQRAIDDPIPVPSGDPPGPGATKRRSGVPGGTPGATEPEPAADDTTASKPPAKRPRLEKEEAIKAAFCHKEENLTGCRTSKGVEGHIRTLTGNLRHHNGRAWEFGVDYGKEALVRVGIDLLKKAWAHQCGGLLVVNKGAALVADLFEYSPTEMKKQ
jgi:hypothetical protein